MAETRPVRVFVLGSFRDARASRTRSRGVLRRLVEALRAAGCDAFLSGDARSLELAGHAFAPRPMTDVLEGLCDLALFVGVKAGRGEGWVSEITAMQVLVPERSTRRVVLLETGYPLTSILDPLQQGYLADPPVMIGTWSREAELHDLAIKCATSVARFGRLPPIL